MDRREKLLNSECHKLIDDKGLPLDGSELILVYKPAAISAMDEYMRECSLELLEYMAKNNVEICYDPYSESKKHFLFKGYWINKEQLFENFL